MGYYNTWWSGNNKLNDLTYFSKRGFTGTDRANHDPTFAVFKLPGQILECRIQISKPVNIGIFKLNEGLVSRWGWREQTLAIAVWKTECSSRQHDRVGFRERWQAGQLFLNSPSFFRLYQMWHDFDTSEITLLIGQSPLLFIFKGNQMDVSLQQMLVYKRDTTLLVCSSLRLPIVALSLF